MAAILQNENLWISIKIALKFVPKGPIPTFADLKSALYMRHLASMSSRFYSALMSKVSLF